MLDAAGNGALGIAWRVDKPRTYTAIAVAVRDPGGMLSGPIEIAGAGSGGVRHPAITVDRTGDALLAYDAPRWSRCPRGPCPACSRPMGADLTRVAYVVGV